MADVDEDVPQPEAPSDADADLTDETPDFRFLATTIATTAATTTIPKRGLKDFEPLSTSQQSAALTSSRTAMHNALAAPRLHPPNHHGRCVGVYHRETRSVYVDRPRGPLFARMGRVAAAGRDPCGEVGRRAGRVWLWAEEAVYLVERGSLDLRWEREEGDGEEGGMPMSLQAAYAMLLSGGDEDGVSLEEYLVFANLKRMGYTVWRAPKDGVDACYDKGPAPTSTANRPWSLRLGLGTLTTWLTRPFTIDALRRNGLVVVIIRRPLGSPCSLPFLQRHLPSIGPDSGIRSRTATFLDYFIQRPNFPPHPNFPRLETWLHNLQEIRPNSTPRLPNRRRGRADLARRAGSGPVAEAFCGFAVGGERCCRYWRWCGNDVRTFEARVEECGFGCGGWWGGELFEVWGGGVCG